MPTAYALIAAYIAPDGEQCWLTRTLDGQRMFTTLGMVRFYERLIEEDVMDRTTGGDQ